MKLVILKFKDTNLMTFLNFKFSAIIRNKEFFYMLQTCTCRKFHKHLQAAFEPISFHQKMTSINCTKYIKAVQNTFI